MPHSFHSHSGQFCKHGTGDLEESVLKAIELGFTHYGMSEHVPRYSDAELYAEELAAKLTPAKLAEMFDSYALEARRLQVKYAGQIHLLVGCESEFINQRSLEEAIQLRQRYKLDYVVGSVHHVREIPIDWSKELYAEAEQACGGLEQLFLAYFDAQLHVMETLRPTVLAHFDLIRMFRPDHPISPACWESIRRNLRRAAELGILVEINSRAYKKKLPEPYPHGALLDEAVRLQVRFCLGDDSHCAADVGMHYTRLPDYLQAHAVNSLCYLETSSAGSCEVRTLEQPWQHAFWAKFTKTW
jgi:histidinol-phosphatase (PHP family)